MKFATATESYESWLGGHLRLVQRDLTLKHERMRSGSFEFLRATFYRWAQTWRKVCGDAAAGPEVLSVGDLHIENFGTWRDAEGRLVWGVNDFDEAWLLPFTHDLIRLATSACIARLSCDAKACAAAVLEGYADALETGGRPLVLAEHHAGLRDMASERLHHPETYWDKLTALKTVHSVPQSALKAIGRLMPEQQLAPRVVHRVAGLGSLGRERYTAIVKWKGGLIAREAKALAPSACAWAEDRGGLGTFAQKVLERAVRCRDPFVHVDDQWIVRRLAPDCSRIELSALPKQRDERRLLRAMGWETANVHLGTAKPRVLKEGLANRPRNWLYRAAQRMEAAILTDFEAYSTR